MRIPSHGGANRWCHLFVQPSAKICRSPDLFRTFSTLKEGDYTRFGLAVSDHFSLFSVNRVDVVEIFDSRHLQIAPEIAMT